MLCVPPPHLGLLQPYQVRPPHSATGNAAHQATVLLEVLFDPFAQDARCSVLTLRISAEKPPQLDALSIAFARLEVESRRACVHLQEHLPLSAWVHYQTGLKRTWARECAGQDNFCLIHVSLVPVLGVVGEQVRAKCACEFRGSLHAT